MTMLGTSGKLTAIALLAAAVLLPGSVPGARGEGGEPGEFQVKAAYLYHFAQFVDWPSEAAGRAAPTLTICVLGSTPLGGALNAIGGKAVRNRRVATLHLNRIEEMGECDILFVSASEKRRLPQILAQLESRPVLTVSDIKRFTGAGGMIGLVPVHDKIRFEINQRAALNCGLRISSQLLKLATRVTE